MTRTQVLKPPGHHFQVLTVAIFSPLETSLANEGNEGQSPEHSLMFSFSVIMTKEQALAVFKVWHSVSFIALDLQLCTLRLENKTVLIFHKIERDMPWTSRAAKPSPLDAELRTSDSNI